MRLMLAFGLAVGLAGVAAADDKKDEKPDPAKLVGTWKLTKTTSKTPDPGRRFVFTKDGEFATRSGDGLELKGTYTVSVSTVEVRLTQLEGHKDAREVATLTDTALHLKTTTGPEQGRVDEFERVAEETKDDKADDKKADEKKKKKKKDK